jgi:phosphotransacetylase
MAHHGIPHDTHIVDPRSGLATRAWHYFFEMVGRHLVAAAEVEEITTADATDLATALVLVNELKDKFNELTLALGREA